ncbi:4a-hydroxytetrahydrobiopterin dehydratase [Marinobacter sp.]|uniref:4a-hydroxytetrahydrobiopterin dehydratase n=1 Tax=Marinobacter sp. TaxID=50741 RepID=UPI002B26AE20|nr:4a-hydroxytetrahydrobiopterin dehydratase [Marinobacter sp.]
MSELAKQHCEACRKGAPQATEDERSFLHGQIPDWNLVDADVEEKLQKVFKFKNFAQAQAFTNQVGDLAEAENHHPAVLLEYGKVTVSWWTHAIGGLHRNDFVMAAKTDAAFARLP